MAPENLFEKFNNFVIKIGTAGITTDNDINHGVINNIASDCSEIIEKGKHVTIVTSGAIACGKRYANFDFPSMKEEADQYYASIGQVLLMHAYIEAFKKYDLKVAQILLTDEDFDSRKRLQLLKTTHKNLIDNMKIPIFNENDPIATDEITFGDNDILAAKITADLNQDVLLNLIVYDGLLKNGNVIETAISYEKAYYDDLSMEARRDGSGGLESKLKSVKYCISAGKICRIGNVSKGISEILKGNVLCTTFYP